MEKFIRFFIKLLPFFPSEKDTKKLVYSFVYHIIIFICGMSIAGICVFLSFLAITTMFLLPIGIIGIIVAVIIGILMIGYTSIGIILSLGSYLGASFISQAITYETFESKDIWLHFNIMMLFYDI